MMQTATERTAPSVDDQRRDPADRRDYLSVADAATLLGVSQKTLQRAIRGTTRPLPHIRIGRRVLLARVDIDRWLAAQRIVPSVSAPALSGGVGALLQRLHSPRSRSDQRRRG